LSYAESRHERSIADGANIYDDNTDMSASSFFTDDDSSKLTSTINSRIVVTMTELGPLAVIDSLLADKRHQRAALDADIKALERSRELLAQALEGPKMTGLSSLLEQTAEVGTPPPPIAPGAWHPAALKVLEDGLPHTTAEVHTAVVAAMGQDIGYHAVASWLNRMAENGTLAKERRGEFRRPSASPAPVTVNDPFA